MSDRAYLDIETSFLGEITVVGIFLAPKEVVQLIGGEVNKNNLLNVLSDSDVIVTYNGNRFDLPIIRRRVGLNLKSMFKSHDLMYDCWREGLYGGLKAVERKLGIKRETEGITGRDAPILWDRYKKMGDYDALDLLLKYNRDDIINLPILEEHLNLIDKSEKEVASEFEGEFLKVGIKKW